LIAIHGKRNLEKRTKKHISFKIVGNLKKELGGVSYSSI
jgi:hypothetical protein